MDAGVKERLWNLYCRHQRRLKDDARAVRDELGFTSDDVIRVAHLTRTEFEACLSSPGKYPAIASRWFSRILQFEEDRQIRRMLEDALGMPAAGVALTLAPHAVISREHVNSEGE